MFRRICLYALFIFAYLSTANGFIGNAGGNINRMLEIETTAPWNDMSSKGWEELYKGMFADITPIFKYVQHPGDISINLWHLVKTLGAVTSKWEQNVVLKRIIQHVAQQRDEHYSLAFTSSIGASVDFSIGPFEASPAEFGRDITVYCRHHKSRDLFACGVEICETRGASFAVNVPKPANCVAEGPEMGGSITVLFELGHQFTQIWDSMTGDSLMTAQGIGAGVSLDIGGTSLSASLSVDSTFVETFLWTSSDGGVVPGGKQASAEDLGECLSYNYLHIAMLCGETLCPTVERTVQKTKKKVEQYTCGMVRHIPGVGEIAGRLCSRVVTTVVDEIQSFVEPALDAVMHQLNDIGKKLLQSAEQIPYFAEVKNAVTGEVKKVQKTVPGMDLDPLMFCNCPAKFGHSHKGGVCDPDEIKDAIMAGLENRKFDNLFKNVGGPSLKVGQAGWQRDAYAITRGFSVSLSLSGGGPSAKFGICASMEKSFALGKCLASDRWGPCAGGEMTIHDDGSFTCKGACEPGTYLSFDECHECPEGRYQPMSGQSSCRDIPPHLRVRQGNSTTKVASLSSARIEPCPTGTLRTWIEEAHLYPEIRRILPGKYSPPPNWEDQIEYSLPDANYAYFEDYNTNVCRSCEEWSHSAFAIVDKEITMVYDNQEESHTIKACGYCDPGYSPYERLDRTCQLCPTGKIVSKETNFRCQACPAGKKFISQSQPCQSCPAGTYQPNEGQSVCIDCEVGRHSSEPESVQCTVCAPGKKQPLTGQTICPECEVGTYQPNQEQTSCIDCEVGRKQHRTGATKCDLCPPGKKQPAVKQTSCITCADGRYQPQPESVDCIDCSANTFTNARTSKHKCSVCPEATDTRPYEGYRSLEIKNLGQIKQTIRSADDLIAFRDAHDVTFLENKCGRCVVGVDRELVRFDLGYWPKYETSQNLCTNWRGLRNCYVESTYPHTSNPSPNADFSKATDCGPCQPGKHHAPHPSICQPCPANHYQDEYGSTTCKLCPLHYDSDGRKGLVAPKLSEDGEFFGKDFEYKIVVNGVEYDNYAKIEGKPEVVTTKPNDYEYPFENRDVKVYSLEDFFESKEDMIKELTENLPTNYDDTQWATYTVGSFGLQKLRGYGAINEYGSFNVNNSVYTKTECIHTTSNYRNVVENYEETVSTLLVIPNIGGSPMKSPDTNSVCGQGVFGSACASNNPTLYVGSGKSNQYKFGSINIYGYSEMNVEYFLEQNAVYTNGWANECRDECENGGDTSFECKLRCIEAKGDYLNGCFKYECLINNCDHLLPRWKDKNFTVQQDTYVFGSECHKCISRRGTAGAYDNSCLVKDVPYEIPLGDMLDADSWERIDCGYPTGTTTTYIGQASDGICSYNGTHCIYNATDLDGSNCIYNGTDCIDTNSGTDWVTTSFKYPTVPVSIKYRVSRVTDSDKACEACPAGKYGSSPGVCSECPVGKYGIGSNAQSLGITETEFVPARCELCPSGKYQDQTGSTECKPSTLGHYNPTRGANAPVPCPLGYQDQTGQYTCKICVGGYTDSIGHQTIDDCISCGLGTYGDYNKTSDWCEPCEEATYADQTGLEQCKLCPRGKMHKLRGEQTADNCKPCPTGQVPFRTNPSGEAIDLSSEDVQVMHCAGCPAGTYVSPGGGACSSCPAGYSTPGVEFKSAQKLSIHHEFVNEYEDTYRVDVLNDLAIPMAHFEYMDSDSIVGQENYTMTMYGPGTTYDHLDKMPAVGATECVQCPAGKITMTKTPLISIPARLQLSGVVKSSFASLFGEFNDSAWANDEANIDYWVSDSKYATFKDNGVPDVQEFLYNKSNPSFFGASTGCITCPVGSEPNIYPTTTDAFGVVKYGATQSFCSACPSRGSSDSVTLLNAGYETSYRPEDSDRLQNRQCVSCADSQMIDLDWDVLTKCQPCPRFMYFDATYNVGGVESDGIGGCVCDDGYVINPDYPHGSGDTFYAPGFDADDFRNFQSDARTTFLPGCVRNDRLDFYAERDNLNRGSLAKCPEGQTSYASNGASCSACGANEIETTPPLVYRLKDIATEKSWSEEIEFAIFDEPCDGACDFSKAICKYEAPKTCIVENAACDAGYADYQQNGGTDLGWPQCCPNMQCWATFDSSGASQEDYKCRTCAPTGNTCSAANDKCCGMCDPTTSTCIDYDASTRKPDMNLTLGVNNSASECTQNSDCLAGSSCVSYQYTSSRRRLREGRKLPAGTNSNGNKYWQTTQTSSYAGNTYKMYGKQYTQATMTGGSTYPNYYGKKPTTGPSGYLSSYQYFTQPWDGNPKDGSGGSSGSSGDSGDSSAQPSPTGDYCVKLCAEKGESYSPVSYTGRIRSGDSDGLFQILSGDSGAYHLFEMLDSNGDRDPVTELACCDGVKNSLDDTCMACRQENFRCDLMANVNQCCGDLVCKATIDSTQYGICKPSADTSWPSDLNSKCRNYWVSSTTDWDSSLFSDSDSLNHEMDDQRGNVGDNCYADGSNSALDSPLSPSGGEDTSATVLADGSTCYCKMPNTMCLTNSLGYNECQTVPLGSGDYCNPSNDQCGQNLICNGDTYQCEASGSRRLTSRRLQTPPTCAVNDTFKAPFYMYARAKNLSDAYGSSGTSSGWDDGYVTFVYDYKYNYPWSNPQGLLTRLKTPIRMLGGMCQTNSGVSLDGCGDLKIGSVEYPGPAGSSWERIGYYGNTDTSTDTVYGWTIDAQWETKRLFFAPLASDSFDYSVGNSDAVGVKICGPNTDYEKRVENSQLVACPAGQNSYPDGETCKDYSSDSSGVACDPGKTAPAGTCVECPSGTYRNEWNVCVVNTDYSKSVSNGQRQACATGETSRCNNGETCAPAATCHCPAGYQGDLEHCVKCLAGEYSPADSSTCSDCTPGKYSSPGLGACIVCSNGKYGDTAGAPFCFTCTAGFQSSADGQTCESCAAGTFDHDQDATTPCQPCAAGKFDHDSNANTRCQACDVGKSSAEGSTTCVECLRGFVNPIAGGLCLPCANGTYSYGPNNCTACAAGTYDDDSDAFTQCVDCEIGKYNVKEQQVSCVSCPIARYQDQTGQTDCVLCSNGTYQGVTGASAASQCVPCALGTVDHDFRADTECVACGVNQYQDQTGQLECKNCSSGSFSSKGYAQCFTCTPGQFFDSTGCQDCPAHTFEDEVPSTANACEECDPNTYSNPGATECTDCGENTVWVNGACACAVGFIELENKCVYIPVGTYLDNGTVYECPAGTYDDDGNYETACIDCPAGTYSNSSATICTACGVGTYAGVRATDCIQCTAGTIDDDSDASTPCVECPANTYSSGEAATSCTPCATDSYSFVRASECESCPNGHYWNTTAEVKDGCDDNRNLTEYVIQEVNITRNVSVYNNVTNQTDVINVKETVRQTTETVLRNSTCDIVDKDSACEPCPPGTSDDDSDVSTPCVACPAGTYSDGKATSCSACPAGTADLDSDPSTECVPCGTGTYQPNSGQTVCIDVKECTEERLSPTTISIRNESECGSGGVCRDSSIDSNVALGVYECICDKGYGVFVKNISYDLTLKNETDNTTYVVERREYSETCERCDSKYPYYTWSDAFENEPCSRKTCPAGQGIETNISDASVNIQEENCVPCAAGTRSGVNESYCSPCKAGEQCATAAQTNVSTTQDNFCPLGTYDDDMDSATECVSCDKQTYNVNKKPLGQNLTYSELGAVYCGESITCTRRYCEICPQDNTISSVVHASSSKSYVLCDGTTTIKSESFSGIIGMGVYVPASVTSVEQGAFKNSNITFVVFQGSPSTLHASAFDNTHVVAISAPTGLHATLQAQLPSAQIYKQTYDGDVPRIDVTLDSELTIFRKIDSFFELAYMSSQDKDLKKISVPASELGIDSNVTRMEITWKEDRTLALDKNDTIEIDKSGVHFINGGEFFNFAKKQLFAVSNSFFIVNENGFEEDSESSARRLNSRRLMTANINASTFLNVTEPKIIYGGNQILRIVKVGETATSFEVLCTAANMEECGGCAQHPEFCDKIIQNADDCGNTDCSSYVSDLEELSCGDMKLHYNRVGCCSTNCPEVGTAYSNQCSSTCN